MIKGLVSDNVENGSAVHIDLGLMQSVISAALSPALQRKAESRRVRKERQPEVSLGDTRAGLHPL